MEQITNPHDKVVKEVFTRRDAAEDYLPGEVAGLLDRDSLELARDTFVDPHLETYFPDLLFKAYFKEGMWGYVYVLFQHKSYREPLEDTETRSVARRRSKIGSEPDLGSPGQAGSKGGLRKRELWESDVRPIGKPVDKPPISKRLFGNSTELGFYAGFGRGCPLGS